MTSTASYLTINNLTFTGQGKEVAGLAFTPALNVIYGASNTGKTFTVKSFDFMLGGKGPLPDNKERVGYDKIWMALDLPKTGDATIMRALAGGQFALLPGHVIEADLNGNTVRRLSARNDSSNLDNLSQFLLNELNLVGREIATDVSGKKRALSFRDLTRFCRDGPQDVPNDDKRQTRNA